MGHILLAGTGAALEYPQDLKLDMSKPIEMFDGEHVARATLLEDQEIDGIWYAGGAEIHFQHNCEGKLSQGTLAADQEVDDRAVCRKGTKVKFHTDQRLESCTLAKDQEIDGITAKGGTKVSYWQDGGIAVVQLANDQKVRAAKGLFCKGGSLLIFYPDGSIMDAFPAKPQEVNDIFVAAEKMSFRRNGSIISAGLSKDQTIDKIGCKGGKKAWLHEDDSLETCTLNKEKKFGMTKLSEGTEIYLDEDGGLTRAILGKPTNIQGITCSTHWWGVMFHKNGRIKAAIMEGKQDIQGHHCSDGDAVLFDENGVYIKKLGRTDGLFPYGDASTVLQ